MCAGPSIRQSLYPATINRHQERLTPVFVGVRLFFLYSLHFGLADRTIRRQRNLRLFDRQKKQNLPFVDSLRFSSTGSTFGPQSDDFESQIFGSLRRARDDLLTFTVDRRRGWLLSGTAQQRLNSIKITGWPKVVFKCQHRHLKQPISCHLLLTGALFTLTRGDRTHSRGFSKKGSHRIVATGARTIRCTRQPNRTMHRSQQMPLCDPASSYMVCMARIRVTGVRLLVKNSPDLSLKLNWKIWWNRLFWWIMILAENLRALSEWNPILGFCLRKNARSRYLLVRLYTVHSVESPSNKLSILHCKGTEKLFQEFICSLITHSILHSMAISRLLIGYFTRLWWWEYAFENSVEKWRVLILARTI